MNDETHPIPTENSPPPEPPVTDAAAPVADAAASEAASEATPEIAGPMTPETVMTALKQVIDPELHFNIVDLGLVYEVRVNRPEVDVDMTLTSPACPFGPILIHDVKMTVAGLGVETDDVNIELVWDPPWGPDKMSDEAKLELGFDVDMDF